MPEEFQVSVVGILLAEVVESAAELYQYVAVVVGDLSFAGLNPVFDGFELGSRVAHTTPIQVRGLERVG